MPIMPLPVYVPRDPYSHRTPLTEADGETLLQSRTGDRIGVISEFADRGSKHIWEDMPGAILRIAVQELAPAHEHTAQINVRPYGLHCDDERELVLVINQYEDWVSRESNNMRWYHAVRAYTHAEGDQARLDAMIHERTGMGPNELDDLNAKTVADTEATIAAILDAYWELLAPVVDDEVPLQRRAEREDRP